VCLPSPASAYILDVLDDDDDDDDDDDVDSSNDNKTALLKCKKILVYAIFGLKLWGIGYIEDGTLLEGKICLIRVV
jgi:hypothetical protein